MNRSIRSLGAATGIAAIAFAGIAAAPSAPESVDITNNERMLTISGILPEKLANTSVVNDADDVPVPMTGHDIVSYSTSFPVAGKVAFHLEIDANPVTGFAPALAQYAINPTIGATSYELTASASVLTLGSLDFASQTCAPDPDTGTNTCTPSPIEGEYVDGIITWFVPSDAAPGTVVSGGKAVVNPYFEAVWLINGLIDTVTGSSTHVPSAKLLIDGVVVATGTLSNDKGFSVTVDLPMGTYEHAELLLCQADFGLGYNECTTVALGTIQHYWI